MTFRDVVIKNFKGSFRQYFAYYLSSSFSIMLFFMYATLILNKQLEKRDDTEALAYVFPITMVAIAFFSVFFINYAHSAYIKGRNGEFGIYITLGIHTKELRKLINLESIIIDAASLLTGIGVGTLFSRLFQMVILSLLDINDITFSLDYRPFLITILVFFFIFLTVMIRTFLRMNRLDISGLLREVRNSEGREYDRRDPIFGGLGLIIMAGSVVFLVIIANQEKLNSNPLVLMTYMVTAFLGVYLTLSNGGNLVIHLIKKSTFYQKHLLTIAQLHYKFNQNKKIIFVLSVLSTMTIFLVASPFSLFRLSESIAEMQEYHLEYVETDTMNKLPEGKLDDILNGHGVKSNSTVKFIYLSTKKNSELLRDSKPVVSASDYNSLTGSKIELSEGEAFNAIIDWRPGNQGIEQGSEHELYVGNDIYSFKFIDSRRGDWIADMSAFPAGGIVVISDVDYQKLSANITDKNVGYYHLINFDHWKNSEKVVNELKAALGQSELKLIYIMDYYESLKSNYSVFLFVSTVMGILFLVAGGSVLYFKQFTELGEAKQTFKKLFKIGITDKETKRIIGGELFVVFFLPLLFGTFLGVSLIYLMTYIVGGEEIIREFITNAFVVVALYFVSQGVFYLITRSKYIGEITSLKG
jgi:putative ABC transport system permease protein